MNKSNQKIVFTILNLYINVLKAIRRNVISVYFYDYIRNTKDHITIKFSTISRVSKKFNSENLDRLIKTSSIITKKIMSGSRSVSQNMYPTIISIAYQYINTVGKKLSDYQYNHVVAYINKLERIRKRKKIINHIEAQVTRISHMLKSSLVAVYKNIFKKWVILNKSQELHKIFSDIIMWSLIIILILMIFLNSIGIRFVSLLVLCIVITIMMALVIITKVKNL